jgi:hypothetical protein
MAAVGMLHLVAAPITSHTDGTAITYGAGFLVGPAVDASITFNYNDNPDYGEDIIQENDNGINGYSGTLENNYINAANAAKLYGWEASGTGDNVEYEANDGAAPQVGFGYVRKMLNNGTTKIRAFWFHKAQITPGSYANAHTKERQISWQHDTSNITGFGAYLDATGKAKYFIVKEFATVADAETWLDDKANI